MTRKVVMLVVLAALVGAAGAYAQEALQKEDPSMTDVVQIGVLYAGSICSGDDQPDYRDFYFRVTRELKDGWVEVEYARYLTRAYSQNSFKPEPKPLRLNVRRMCSIQIADLSQ